MRAVACLAVLALAGCVHSVNPAEGGPAAPPGQAVRMVSRFAWPSLPDTQVQVHQRTIVNGRSTEAAQAWLRLVHTVQPGYATVRLDPLGEQDPSLEVKPFVVEISRDGRLLTRPASREARPAERRPYAHSPQFLWNLWVALWNPTDLVSGQTVELPNEVDDEFLGHLRFTAYLTGDGYAPCEGAPSGWCQKLNATFRPDAPSVLALFNAVVDEKDRRPGEAFEPRAIEYELQLLSEPETLLPHRLDLSFRVEVLTGPPRSTSIVRYEQKTSMRFVHLQRQVPPPPSGPQRQPTPKTSVPSEQVRRGPVPGDAGKIQPFTAPAVSPPTRYFCSAKKSAITGAETINAPAAKWPHSVLYSPTKRCSATGRVKRAVSLSRVAARMNSFHAVMKLKSAVTASAGRASGSTTRTKTCPGVAPSMIAASSSSRGIVSK